MRKLTLMAIGLSLFFLMGSMMIPGSPEPSPGQSLIDHHRRERKVDFMVDHVRVDPTTNHLHVSIRNTTRVPFQGNVRIRAGVTGVPSPSNSSYEMVFENNPTWIVHIPYYDSLTGEHEIHLYLDNGNSVKEQNEGNNGFKQRVMFRRIGSQDLAITQFSRLPGNHRIFYTVENKANEYMGDLILSVHNNNIRKGDVTHRNVTLQKGQSRRYELSTPLVGGRNIIRLKVDPENRIKETDERNNIKQEIFFPYIQHISLVKYATFGKGSSVVIATRTHPRVVIRPGLLRDVGGQNWGIEVTTKVRGNGARPFNAYRIVLTAHFNGATRTEKAYELSSGPHNGATKDDKLDFFLPKRYCRNGQVGYLVVNLIISGRNYGVWKVDIEFAGF